MLVMSFIESNFFRKIRLLLIVVIVLVIFAPFSPQSCLCRKYRIHI